MVVADGQRQMGNVPSYRDRMFADARPALMSLAYRMLGTRNEAEDAVQDVFVKWHEADQSTIRNPLAWLTTTCTRRCIDLLRHAQRQRTDYVGVWLPEAVHTPVHPEDETAMSIATSLSTAFLLMLERLSPRERAAYLLHDIFEMPYSRIAEILELQETSCRKLVSRARVSIGKSKARIEPPPAARQEDLLAAFHDAIATGDATKFAAMLSEDIEIRHDSGGKVGAAIHVLQGKTGVLEFIQKFLHRVWKHYRWTVSELNGTRGVLLEKEGVVVTAVLIGFGEAGEANHIYILRNPNKLAGLSKPSIASWLEKLA